MSFGTRLRHAREEQGLSIEDIAQRTFIRVSHLEAIEREDFSAIPPSRLHYFVRDYARTLGFDPEEFERELPQTTLPVHTPPSTAISSGSPVTGAFKGFSTERLAERLKERKKEKE